MKFLHPSMVQYILSIFMKLLFGFFTQHFPPQGSLFHTINYCFNLIVRLQVFSCLHFCSFSGPNYTQFNKNKNFFHETSFVSLNKAMKVFLPRVLIKNNNNNFTARYSWLKWFCGNESIFTEKALSEKMMEELVNELKLFSTFLHLQRRSFVSMKNDEKFWKLSSLQRGF
jgi:hypothetical protein